MTGEVAEGVEGEQPEGEGADIVKKDRMGRNLQPMTSMRQRTVATKNPDTIFKMADLL